MVKKEKIDQVLTVVSQLLSVKNQSLLLNRGLTKLMCLLGIEAGSIYLVQGQRLIFETSKNELLDRRLPFGKQLMARKASLPLNDRSIAGYVASAGLNVNLSDVYQENDTQPYRFDPSMDEQTGYRSQSMLTVPIFNFKHRVIGVLQLINIVDRNSTIRAFTVEDEQIVELFLRGLTPALHYTQIIADFSAVICELIYEHHPQETYWHARRVAVSAAEIYKNWAYKRGIEKEEVFEVRDTLTTLGMFHDLNLLVEGEVSVEALLKVNRLCVRHETSFLNGLRELVLSYREAWDGSGLPGHIDWQTGNPLVGYAREDGTAFGKQEREIPINGRIIAIAHFYDRLLHRLTEAGREELVTKDQQREAVHQILALSGRILDPEVVNAFMSSLENLQIISEWV